MARAPFVVRLLLVGEPKMGDVYGDLPNGGARLGETRYSVSSGAVRGRRDISVARYRFFHGVRSAERTTYSVGGCSAGAGNWAP